MANDGRIDDPGDRKEDGGASEVPDAPMPAGSAGGRGGRVLPPGAPGALGAGYATYGPATPEVVAAGADSDKSFVATWLFAWFLGWLGIDRFYLGKTGTALLKLVTFGGCGLWVLIDLILVLAGAQRDKQGRRLAGYDEYKKVAWIVTAVAVVIGAIVGAITGSTASSNNGAAPQHTAVVQPAATSPTDAGEASGSVTASSTPAGGAPKTVQAWADETFGTFAPVQQSGRGDSLVKLPGGVKAAVVTATHSGAANFALSVLGADNEPTGDLLVNTIGAYSGTTAFGLTHLGTPATLQVTADGAWTISVAPISTAPAMAAQGNGDAVFLYDGHGGALTATNSGEGNFTVVQTTDSAFDFGLLINEIGSYHGTVPLKAGPSVLQVGSDGAWTLSVG